MKAKINFCHLDYANLIIDYTKNMGYTSPTSLKVQGLLFKIYWVLGYSLKDFEYQGGLPCLPQIFQEFSNLGIRKIKEPRAYLRKDPSHPLGWSEVTLEECGILENQKVVNVVKEIVDQHRDKNAFEIAYHDCYCGS